MYTGGSMNLTAEQVADILVRRGHITPQQGEDIQKEARMLPGRLRSHSAYEQRAVVYELVGRLRLPDLKNPGTVIGDNELAQAIDHLVQLGCLRGAHGLRFVHAQHHRRRRPVCEHVHGAREQQREHEAVLPADGSADCAEQRSHHGHHREHFDVVHSRWAPDPS